MREARAEGLFRQLCYDLQEGQRDLRADDGGGLQQALLLGWQTIDTGCQNGLHRGRYLHGRQGLRYVIRPGLPRQYPGLHQRPHALLQEERIALRAPDQELVQGPQARIAS
jgi:hypothetical protein